MSTTTSTEIMLPIEEEFKHLQVSDTVGLSKQTISYPTNFSTTGQRIFRVIASLIKDTDQDYKIYRFNLNDFRKVFGIKDNSKINAYIKSALNEITTKMELPIAEGRITSWVLTAQLTNNEVQVTLDPMLVPIYRNSFQKKYRLLNIKGFVNSYTFTLYELFLYMVYDRKECKVSMSLDKIRDHLKLGDKYQKYADLKKRVLLPVLDDINREVDDQNQCNIRVTMQEEKEGRRVVGIVFSVTNISGTETIDLAEDDFEIKDDVFSTLGAQGQSAYTYFVTGLGVTKPVTDEAVKKYGERGFVNIYRYMRTRPLDKQNSNYAVGCFQKNYSNIAGIGVPDEVVEENLRRLSIIGPAQLEEKIEKIEKQEQEEKQKTEAKVKIIKKLTTEISEARDKRLQEYLAKASEEEKEIFVEKALSGLKTSNNFRQGILQNKNYKDILENTGMFTLAKQSLLEEFENNVGGKKKITVPKKVREALSAFKSNPEYLLQQVVEFIVQNYDCEDSLGFLKLSYEEIMEDALQKQVFYKLLNLYLQGEEEK